MKKFTLFCFFLLSMQAMSTNLVIESHSGATLLQDITLIGQWKFQDDYLYLLDKSGAILASESLDNIKEITFSNSVNTNLNNVQSYNTIVVYPNPTQDVLYVKGMDAQTIRVYDLKGNMLLTEHGTQIHVADIANGTYLLQIGTQVVRFIKK